MPEPGMDDVDDPDELGAVDVEPEVPPAAGLGVMLPPAPVAPPAPPAASGAAPLPDGIVIL